MRNRWKKAWEELGKNRGSGVVLVLVAISCITLMSVSLLHMSYTAFKMKATEQQNKADFYMAEAEVDELLASVQVKVSEAIAEAQKKTLIYYSSKTGIKRTETVIPLVGGVPSGKGTSSDEEPDTLESQVEFDSKWVGIFQSAYFEQIEAWAKMSNTEFTKRSAENEVPVIYDGFYDLAILSELYNGASNASGTTTIIGKSVGTQLESPRGAMEKNTTTGEIILKDVQISHTSAKSGNITNYEFDIVIHVPDFYYVQEGDTASAPLSTESADAESGESETEEDEPIYLDPGSWKIDDVVTIRNWRTY